MKPAFEAVREREPIYSSGANRRIPQRMRWGRLSRFGGRSGRFAVLNAFTDCALADLTGTETKVWLILFRDAKAATGTARTGQADIARRAGLEPLTVRRALASLESKGLVRVVLRGRLNAGPSIYRVHPTSNTGETGL